MCHTQAQDEKKEQQLYRYAVKLEQEGKNSEALTIYKNLLRSDSSNIDYLWRTSFIYSKLGYDQPTEEQRQQWYKTAAYLGKKAVTQYPQNANAHYAYAVSIGRMSENAGNRTKIDNAKLIKSGYVYLLNDVVKQPAVKHYFEVGPDIKKAQGFINDPRAYKYLVVEPVYQDDCEVELAPFEIGLVGALGKGIELNSDGKQE